MLRALEGDPKFEASQDLPDFPYARYAELIGLKGARVESPVQIGDAWDEVLTADRPAVLEAVTDPEVPPFAAAHHFRAGEALPPLRRDRRQRQASDDRAVVQGEADGVPAGAQLAMAMAAQRLEAPIERLEVAAYTIPTDTPESDGTLER